jgi:aromatic ring-cleaving dioxygenase
MAEAPSPLGAADAARITGYHAHVYYRDAAQRGRAAELREAIAARYEVALGRWHDVPVGPHPIGMYQVAFAVERFAAIVPWLALNRGGLSILVHPETGDDPTDHSDHAIWLGDQLPLDIEYLRRLQRA